jgi:hypothetical protein
MNQGWPTLNWRYDYLIESVRATAGVDESLFRGIVLPQGTKVSVLDEEGNLAGELQQDKEGIPELALPRYEKMASEAKARQTEREARRKAARERVKKRD